MSDFDEKDLLTRELHERSGDVGGHPIGLHHVRASARRIRRRRSIVTGAVAAVVAGIALPTGLALTSVIDGANGPVDEPPVATTPSVEPSTPAASPRPDGTFPLTLGRLPRGAFPQVPYIDGRNRSIVVDGDTFQTPIAYQQATPYAGGWLALGYEGGDAEMFVLGENMQVGRSFPSGASFAVSNDGSQVAYVEIQEDGSQSLVNAPTDGGDTEAWTFPADPAVEAVGLVDQGTVVYQTQEAEPRVGLVSAEGRTPIDGFVSVSDADIVNGLIVGQTRSDLVNGSCYGVMEPAVSTTRMVWETCDYSLDGFSADGSHLLGTIPDSDGMGPPTLAVLDTQTRELVVEFSAGRNDPTVLFQRTWEDEDTILGIVTEGATYSIQRFELDGHTEEAADPVTVDRQFGDVPLWFGARAW